MSTTPSAQEQDTASPKNSPAPHDEHGHRLGGVEPFEVYRSRVLLIDNAYHYCFSIGYPKLEAKSPPLNVQVTTSWLVTLQCG
jgi:hypothetical protein